MKWDAEGHLATLTEADKTSSYVYDADGNRLIAKNADGSSTLTLLQGNVTHRRRQRHQDRHPLLHAQRRNRGRPHRCDHLVPHQRPPGHGDDRHHGRNSRPHPPRQATPLRTAPHHSVDSLRNQPCRWPVRPAG
ncbi:RHS repeat protein (plasmid) [Streptomyces sp. NBC_01591]|nr:RHS repeat domain-containing protein [Streptomyces sp. NBC_01591]WSD74650.1 RHS repeat protein [Streptomyces sp. NBC_01591]